ncbi:hypothetical protein ABVK25_000715 [Lepraria finkii]|uniref:Uncharacterized protein n=1 Tax=Lepraria finkii TaxID=1340010 RepID=A0ABR4BNN2_9LECA
MQRRQSNNHKPAPNLPPPPPPTSSFQSFSAPILNLQDTHVSAPFFGPNVWEGTLIPVTGGGIPAHHNLVQIKLTFKEGGTFDFSSTYERIKETLSQALEVARESGRAVGNGGVDVDLEQLPAYEEASGGGGGQTQIQRPVPIAPDGARRSRPAPPANNGVVGLEDQTGSRAGPSSRQQPLPPPDEPPPGYEEAQQSSVADQLEESVRKEG